MSMIPNPNKSVVVDFTIAEIKSSLDKISTYFANKYTLDKKNELLNQYTFSALEFLSLGVYIDINLNYVSENKTNIIVEVRRKIGSFDQTFEVQKANQHIAALFDGISVLLTNVRKAAIPIEAENPIQMIKYDLCWDDIKRHLSTFLLTYPTTYKLVLENNSTDEIVLRRLPHIEDDVAINIDAIIKITKISSNENSSEVRYEISNEKNKISTQGELQRNTLILQITIKVLLKIINDLKTKIIKAENELSNIKEWRIGRNAKAKEEQIEAQIKIIEEFKTKLKVVN